MASSWTIVLDIGKTLSKATLWDEGGVCVAQRSRPNQRLNTGVSFTLDTAGIEYWLEGTLKEFATLGPVGAIVPVAHGAGAALIRDDRLQCAPIDYEWPGVGGDRAAYNQERDPFAASGSPALPAGLNLGLQFHWLESLRSGNFRSGLIVPWAQYWAWLLSGVAASELSSLGCHTDLWRPYDRRPSELAVRRGWAERLAPLTPASAVLGRLMPEWVNRTGLSPRVEIYCGLHDSNAALVAARQHPAMQGHDATVLSTGTWFVAMRSPLPTSVGWKVGLLETRDCLVNVDVEGAPVPSARFMGGREIEMLTRAPNASANSTGSENGSCLDAANPLVQQDFALRAIKADDLILPSAVTGVGPFPNAKRSVPMAASDIDEASAKAHLYVALVADVSLDLIGSCDVLFVDGRFSRSAVFTSALAALRPDTAVLVSDEEHGVARGALRLIGHAKGHSTVTQRVAPLPADMSAYRERWREAAERVG